MRHFVPQEIAMVFVLLSVVITGRVSQAQTFTVLYSFDFGDGYSPEAGLSMDQRGNLYGTTSQGGNGGFADGTVFELTHRNSGWTLQYLYTFTGSNGNTPQSRVIIGPNGDLYGTTTYGGAEGYGIVFRLMPPAHACVTAICPAWTETLLHSFSGGSDGANPCFGDLVFDQAGNLYGTTYGGGMAGFGTVFELSPSGGGWAENVLYSFQGGNDGAGPCAGVTFDNAGNLYGTTVLGGASNDGTVYELGRSGSGWTKTILHNFDVYSGGDGSQPFGGLILDSSGNLYGTTNQGGNEEGGIVYELSPGGSGWTYNILYAFEGSQGSYAKLAMDAAGNLYGTLVFSNMEVFRLTPSGGQWTLTGFSGGVGDFPLGNVIFDASGNLYTTASEGCGPGCVFEITP